MQTPKLSQWFWAKKLYFSSSWARKPPFRSPGEVSPPILEPGWHSGTDVALQFNLRLLHVSSGAGEGRSSYTCWWKKSGDHHLECIKPVVNNGIKIPSPQLVSLPDFWTINSSTSGKENNHLPNSSKGYLGSSEDTGYASQLEFCPFTSKFALQSLNSVSPLPT